MGRHHLPHAVSVTRLVLQGSEIEPGEVRVPPEAAHHARVARVARGAPVEVLNLAGTVGVGVLLAWEGRSCVVRVDSLELERGEPPAPLVLALAVLHTQAFAWAVEKATELGASDVVPVLTGRVQGRRHQGRADRWQRVADAAVAQCGRSRSPRVAPPTALSELLRTAVGARLVAHFAGPVAGEEVASSAGMTVLVGPEGGFTEREVADVLAAGFRPLRLGPRVLRAETAAVAALAVAQQAAGWLSL